MTTATNISAQLLADARLQHERLSELTEEFRPEKEAVAYEVQAKLVPLLLHHLRGKVIGYKIACTNKLAQEQLHVSEPFFGRLLSATTYESGAKLNAGEYFMRVAEAEFAFRMGDDLPAAKGPWSPEQVRDAVAGVLPGVEIVDSRFDDWTSVGTPSLIADNACHAAWIKGAMVRKWQDLDLAATPVRLEVNGAVKAEGSGAAVLGNPLNALHWLANRLNEFGLSLREGQYVTTGVTTDIYMVQSGDRVAADFGPVGRVEFSF